MSARDSPDPDNPLEWILDNYYDTSNGRGKENVESILFRQTVALDPWLEEHDTSPREVTIDDAKEFLEDLTKVYAASTQHQVAQRIRFIYSKLQSRGVVGIDANPFDAALEDHNILDKVYDEETYIYEKHKVKEYLGRLHPYYFAETMTMIKTCRRIGGTVNLDFCDVHLDHPGADWELDSNVRNHPDHIHYSPEPEHGEEFRGEIRERSAKTETRTLVPMDEELKETLLWYIMLKPGPNSGPLFIKPGKVGQVRATGGGLSTQSRKIAKELGMRSEGFDSSNVRPHYWRHWTTSQMKDRMRESIVKYFRGDKEHVSDDYDHYTEEKANAWRENIPKLLNEDLIQLENESDLQLSTGLQAGSPFNSLNPDVNFTQLND